MFRLVGLISGNIELILKLFTIRKRSHESIVYILYLDKLPLQFSDNVHRDIMIENTFRPVF